MRLLIDIGNTNLHWTLDGPGTAWSVASVRHSGGIPPDLIAAWERLSPPERILVSHVAGPGLAESLTRVARALWRVEPEFVRVIQGYGGIQVAYSQPERLGVDRWLALLAARRLHQEATLILDAGTAATFDLLLADGRHLGGLILPGIELMRSSLFAKTQIPPPAEPIKAGLAYWGTDTQSAIALGSIQALAATAERLYDRLAAESGSTPWLVLTGGDAGRIGPFLLRPWTQIADLVLRGLAEAGALDRT
ncbi:type III pantothenate kinase [Caldichromatium japonicum]|uniref:Type III pantothenate kinase n=1 Tax=Caldichromatium japonicum TaxID=2699430 RepID=A0A6G7VFP1_9GAMM|nr:type III pantothenate kinase [Caldichromatium japonicum]QIK38804.1 type III pantothenate kinase [Caldichromatium japonicum]